MIPFALAVIATLGVLYARHWQFNALMHFRYNEQKAGERADMLSLAWTALAILTIFVLAVMA